MESEAVLLPLMTYDKYYIPLEFYNEREQRFDMIQIDARPVGIVGAIVLFNDYHEDQLWLPFSAFVLAKSPPTKEERARKAMILADNARRKEQHKEWRAMMTAAEREEDEDEDEDEDWSDYTSSYERDRWRQEMAQKIESPMYVRDDEFYKLFDRVTQGFLPFIEIQACTDREYHSVKHTWGRNGKAPPTLPVGYNYDRMSSRQMKRYQDERPALELPIPLSRYEAEEWLKANISGRFHITDKANGVVMFELYPDWLFARLRFAGKGPE